MPSKHREEGVCKVKWFCLQSLYLSAHNFCRLFITKQFWPSHSSLSHQKGFKAHMLLQHLHCHLRRGTQSSLQPLQHYPQHTHTLLQLPPPLRCTDTNGQNYQVYTKQEKSVHLIFTIKAVEAQFKRTLYNPIALEIYLLSISLPQVSPLATPPPLLEAVSTHRAVPQPKARTCRSSMPAAWAAAPPGAAGCGSWQTQSPSCRACPCSVGRGERRSAHPSWAPSTAVEPTSPQPTAKGCSSSPGRCAADWVPAHVLSSLPIRPPRDGAGVTVNTPGTSRQPRHGWAACLEHSWRTRHKASVQHSARLDNSKELFQACTQAEACLIIAESQPCEKVTPTGSAGGRSRCICSSKS